MPARLAASHLPRGISSEVNTSRQGEGGEHHQSCGRLGSAQRSSTWGISSEASSDTLQGRGEEHHQPRGHLGSVRRSSVWGIFSEATSHTLRGGRKHHQPGRRFQISAAFRTSRPPLLLQAGTL
ncbi:hypothetical protein NDU88_004935 [Pleurodeles waltl]|uniref:Uncharacterized protein n=1 Tax=Pleurodeles waltl TaxID=8319 RepID=A0AAV7QDW8_PLEWA|nr:hypothetical protein NDU88_004935 [Pleurodeles waltl]